MHEGTDGERGQCSAGESGLLSLSVQWGEGTLHSGSGAASSWCRERGERGRETKAGGGGGDTEEMEGKEISRRTESYGLGSVHFSDVQDGGLDIPSIILRPQEIFTWLHIKEKKEQKCDV